MSYTINDMFIGQKACFEKTITESDVLLFSGISGDINPVHINDVVAKESIFGRRVAHGVLVSGLTSAVLGMQLPGEGTIYLGQDSKFRRPVYIGDTVKATCEVIELNTEKNIVRLATTTTNQNNEIVIEGIAVVMAPKKRA
ncbi:MaoC family dehydratase [Salmonella enterica]|uniref:MaoC family dehydratase n=4 Tax=Salmonella enterica TaxID=28901 RepID=A0A5U3D6B1_SALDZ|nr:MaoC family dehydratase [Salmonella enterica]AXC69027.1 enoyl-CoA hydratase [Salmonella enterica subsp. diarizonae serovar 59:z10:-]EAA7931549.1 enoyl-CoA hydratase [Salmonella enterica subsp. enterica serovar Redlands]EAB9741421.1 enoyl-CoA hydratase [Salmonella enterica subsp. diarizonae]EBE3722156.1 MaoC family dehydratase [Salmonella enterica subsp. diarizonae serovar 42:l,v:1,5,7]EBH8950454.1 MaoC family dehydratase [Salmonella enterica subsp. diarizonae serovar 48:i:z]EBV2373751.1 en